MEIGIIKGIQIIRNGFFDQLFNIITQLGDLYFFILVLVLIYWLFDKKNAFYLMFAFIMSAAINQVLKLVIKRPRPYVEDPSVGVAPLTSGYSMPSGHAQNTGVLATTFKSLFNKKWLNIASLILLILVPFTRVYLGQHYLTDVLVGLILGIGITILTFKVLKRYDNIHEYIGVTVAAILFVGVVIFSFIPNSLAYEDMKLIYVAVGGMSGFMLGYFTELKVLNYKVTNNNIHRLYRLLVGGVLVAAVYLGLSAILPKNNLYLDFIRYFATALAGTIVSVYAFRLLKI